MQEPNIKIYVAMHEPQDYIARIPYSYYIPIHCGKELYKKEKQSYLLGDNIGDNISILNPWFCELTALYWIWKNDNSKPDDIVGLHQYRRFLIENNYAIYDVDLTMKSIFSSLLSKETIYITTNSYDFMIKQRINPGYTVYEDYAACHNIEDLDIALDIVKQKYPSLYPTIEHEIKESHIIYPCNLFITKKKYLDEYCEFLFDILFELLKFIDLDDNKHEDYQSRVYGFIGERMLRPWIIATGKTTFKSRYLDLAGTSL